MTVVSNRQKNSTLTANSASDVSRRTFLSAVTASTAAPALAQPLAAGTAPPPRRVVGMPSRHLQFTPSIEEVVELTARAGFDAIEWNIRNGGHVEPENVERDLPRAVALTRQAGLKVEMVTTSIQDASSPYAEPILRAMNREGIRCYRSSNYFTWDFAGDMPSQLAALKPKIASIEALNARYDTVTCFHNHPTLGDIGGNVWDLWLVLREFDPKYVGFNFDFCHTASRLGGAWLPAAMVARPYMSAVAFKDFAWVKGGGGANAPVWTRERRPMGQGMVDYAARLKFLRDSGYAGPINMHFEHYDIRGIGIGDMTLDMSRAQFVRQVAGELGYLRAMMRATGFAA